MSSEVANVIIFANNLPVTTNAFSATVALIEGMVKGIVNSRWSRATERACLAGFVIMFFQSVLLLVLRIRTKTFGMVRFNKNGLIILNSSDVTAVTFFIYSSLTVTFFALQLAVEKDLRYEGTALVIFGCKFMAIQISAWAYFWVCACKCAEIFLESDFVSRMRARKEKKLRPILRWGMHSFIVVVVALPIAVVLWTTAKVIDPFANILVTVREVTAALKLAARSYDPQTYNKVQLFQLLLPAQRLLSPLKNLESHLASTMKIYTSVLTFLLLIYIPSLYFALKGLCKRQLIQTEATLSGQSGNLQASNLSKTRRQKRQLVYHAVLAYSSLLVHYPVLFWLAVHTTEGFTLRPLWRVVCYYGLSIPFCITGNVTLSIAIFRSKDLLAETRVLPSKVSDGSLTTASGRGTSGRKAFKLFIGSTGTRDQDIEKESGFMIGNGNSSDGFLSKSTPVLNFHKSPPLLNADDPAHVARGT